MKVTSCLFILATALFLFAGTANAGVLVSEDFSGTPGDDLTDNGWTAKADTIQVQSTMIDVGNSGALVTGNYTRYTREFPSNLDSLAADEELVVQWAFQFDAAVDGWVRVGVNLTDSDLGYGQTYNIQDVAIGHTSGATYGGNGLFRVQLLADTLYDMRMVLTPTTISHEYKERSTLDWLVAHTGLGKFHAAGVGEAFIDGQNTGFHLDTISVCWPVRDCTAVGLPPELDGVWRKDGTGPWDHSGNWDISPAPTTSGHTATFAGAISAPTTVVVDTDVSINAITFDHSISYIVGGAASLYLESNTEAVPRLPTLTVAQGDHQFQVATNLRNDTTVDVVLGSTLTFNNALNLLGNTLTKSGEGTMAINNVLSTGGGEFELLEGAVSGNGIVGGNVMNEGGTISPGNSPQSVAVPEPCGVVLLFLGLSVLLGARPIGLLMKVTNQVVVLTAVLFIFAGTANAGVLLSEDFSGTASDNLTANGWTANNGTYQLSSTTVDAGNSGVQPSSGYTRYTKAAVAASIPAGEELILQWSHQRSAASSGWARVGLNMANSTLGYGHSYNTQDYGGAIGHQSGNTYGGNGNAAVFLAAETLHDYRIVLTPTTISHEYKERSSDTWDVVNSGVGSFHPDGVDEVFIDSDINEFYMDSISLTVTPEPSTLAMLSLGVLFVYARFRRTRR